MLTWTEQGVLTPWTAGKIFFCKSSLMKIKLQNEILSWLENSTNTLLVIGQLPQQQPITEVTQNGVQGIEVVFSNLKMLGETAPYLH